MQGSGGYRTKHTPAATQQTSVVSSALNGVDSNPDRNVRVFFRLCAGEGAARGPDQAVSYDDGLPRCPKPPAMPAKKTPATSPASPLTQLSPADYLNIAGC